MKQRSLYFYGLGTLVLLCAGTLLRTALIYQGWPQTNSDESTMGLMARHIAYNGEHPLLFYGQNYMGSLEAYLGAVFFHFFGPTIFALRLGLIVLYSLFMLCMYFLTCSLYNKPLASVTLLLLSVGPSEVILKQVVAVGGRPENLFLTPLLCLLTGYLVTTSHVGETRRRYIWHACSFLLWGLIAGITLWSDLLVVPFVVSIGLLLLVLSDLRMRRTFITLLVVGFLIGVLPYILSIINPAPGQTSLHLFQTSAWDKNKPSFIDDANVAVSAPTLLDQIEGTLLVSLPVATGANAVCPLSMDDAWPLTPHSSSLTIQCTAVHGLWGLTLIVLWVIAMWQTIKYLRRNWFSSAPTPTNPAEKTIRYRYAARLAILAGAGSTVLCFAAFPQAGFTPWLSNRYLALLLIATPAILAPLWQLTYSYKRARPFLAPLVVFLKYGLLLFVSISLTIGAINTFSNVEGAQADEQQEQALIHNLIGHSITRIYSDYWTCDRIIFESQERIFCSVVDDQLDTTLNRYPPYADAVAKDAYAAYIFQTNTQPTKSVMLALNKQHIPYRQFVFNGYIVYQPRVAISPLQLVGVTSGNINYAVLRG